MCVVIHMDCLECHFRNEHSGPYALRGLAGRTADGVASMLASVQWSVSVYWAEEMSVMDMCTRHSELLAVVCYAMMTSCHHVFEQSFCIATRVL